MTKLENSEPAKKRCSTCKNRKPIPEFSGVPPRDVVKEEESREDACLSASA